MSIFHRPQLASLMAKQLLRPGVLDEGLRSGLFISGLRRTGKTTFITADLIPALESMGAIVIYVDLWSDTLTNPAELVHRAIKARLEDLQSPSSSAVERLKRVNGIDLGVLGFKFGFKLESIGKAGGPTLAQALREVVDQAKTDLVLIIDEVQQSIATEEGQNLLLAIKAARDSINPRPATPGHFLFIGTGSHRAQISELTAKRNQAFAGATSIPYPLLGKDYVEFLLSRVADQVSEDKLPSIDVASLCFDLLGNRPEEMIKAIKQLVMQVGDPDALLPVIASTIRSTTADNEILKMERLGSLAIAIFSKVAGSLDYAKGLFSADAAADYSLAVGREVKIDEIQPVVNALVAENLIMRVGHGSYTISDPFVKEIWQESRSLDILPPPHGND